MFKSLSKLYRDLLHQNIELHNENTKLKLENKILKSKWVHACNASLHANAKLNRIEEELKR